MTTSAPVRESDVRTTPPRTAPVWRTALFVAVVLAVPGPLAGGEPPPAGTTVRGSVEQIHITHARPGARVSVRGRGGFQTAATTDDRGGLVLRGVPPGDGYTVTVEGSGRGPYPVR